MTDATWRRPTDGGDGWGGTSEAAASASAPTPPAGWESDWSRPRAQEPGGWREEPATTLTMPRPPAVGSAPQPGFGAPPAAPPADRARSGGGGAWRSVLAAALVSALVSAGVTLGITSGDEQADSGPLAQRIADREDEDNTPTVVPPAGQIDPLPGGSSVADVATAVLPSVALVEVSSGQGRGSGSAVVYSSDGILVTNNHVVEGANEVTVVTADSERLEAEVVATDPSSDLAVLRVQLEQDLPVIRFAEEPPTVGETAIAVGSPFGLESTVTTGIVSATERVVPAPDAPLVGMLQTDAAINPGNSGGALVNDRGELIGINTAILSETGANNGIGFAIPVSTVLDVAEQLLETGEVRYAQLGVIGASVTPSIAERFGLEAAEGAIIDEVAPGSAADDAGVEADDIVIALGDEEVSSMDDLFAAVRQFDPGDDTEIVVVRDGEELRLPVTMGERPPGD